MKRPSPADTVEMLSIFDRSIELIRWTLRSYYRLTETEAAGAEEDLRAWFHRLVRRGASPPSAQILEVSLVSAACQYGRSLQLWKLHGEKSRDESLNILLSRQPDDVARDLRHRFDSERK
ncbi:MAG TPA: hypothetical protein VGK26_00550 [Thermoanaerobaculia bacterium]|jgi:hypothetical protein